MYAEITAAIQSVKTLSELLTAAKNLANYNEFVAAVSEINTKLMNATTVALASQEKQSALTNRVSELENQLRQIENWESQIKRYKLYEFPTKALAYALQPNMQEGEPMHYLCTTCVNKRQKTILQPKGDNYLHCPVCQTNITAQPVKSFKSVNCPI